VESLIVSQSSSPLLPHCERKMRSDPLLLLRSVHDELAVAGKFLFLYIGATSLHILWMGHFSVRGFPVGPLIEALVVDP
jgi:hypothetical protein